MAASLREMEHAATPPEPPGAHEMRVQQMTIEATRAHQQVSSMQQEGMRLQNEREGLKGQVKELGAAKDRLVALNTQVEPEIRHKVSLFAHISRTTFHFEKLPRIAGTVADPAGPGGIKMFDIDASQTSRFDLVNHLWSLMES